MEKTEQTAEQVVEEVKVEEAKAEEAKAAPVQEVPKGYYIVEQPTGFQRVIALGDQEVSVDALIVKMANALIGAGILKD